MANTYANTPVLSKVKIGEQTYFLKDADARAILDSYKGAVNYDVDTTFDKTKENLATEKAIAAYLEGQIAGLTGAMHFVGIKEALPKAEESNDGDVVIIGTTEYVFAADEWKELGDEGTLVRKTFTIAGIDMVDNITAAELQAALSLKALAYKDSGSVAITTADSVTMGAYTPAGNVTLNPFTQTSTAATLTKADYTPAGSVDGGKVTAAGSVSAAKAANGAFQVSGSISAPTVTVTPATASVQYVTNVGRAATFTEGAYTPGSFSSTSGNYNTDAIKAHVAAGAEIAGDVTAETLIFEAASTAAAVATASYTPGNKAADTFDGGAVPTLGTAQSVVTGITSAQASAPTFTGDKFNFTFAGTEVAVSGASFTGTTATDVLVSEVKYDKATANGASFAGSAAELTGTLNKTEKTVDVTFA